MQRRAATGLALLAILVLAAVLRFSALDWGLRHEVDWDERVFVQSAAWLVASGDLDHRFYEYPGLAVYVLAPAVARHGVPEVGPSGYLAARRMIAGFGVVSVLLVFVFGFRLGGVAVGLPAALLLAVSPLDVQTAHMVRPDVVLAAFVLAALLVFDAARGRPGGDVISGLAIGAATAVKFTGVLVVPSYLAGRWLMRTEDETSSGHYDVRARMTGMVKAGLASLLAFAVLSPYSFVNWRRFVEGMGTQWSYHYASREDARTYLDKVVHDLRRLEDSFGLLAALLIVAGVVFVFREGRRWWPLLVLPPVVIGVMATADVQWPRFLVPITGVLAIVAARLVAEVYRRFGMVAAVVLAVAAAVSPTMDSAAHVRLLARPAARDRVVDWIAAHAQDGARILTSVKGLGLDRGRFEVLTADRLDVSTQRWAGHMDLVVSGAADDPAILPEFDLVHTEPTGGAPFDTDIRVLVPRPSLRPRYVPVPLTAAAVRVSENGEAGAALVDGDVATFWRTGGPQVPEASWIEIDLPARQTIGRVVVGLGRHWRREPKNLHILARDGAGEWRRVRAWPGRAPVEQQPLPTGERALEYVLDPQPATALRIVQVGRAGKHWNAAELRIDALP